MSVVTVEVGQGVATIYRDGVRVGESQAGELHHAAAGVPWPGCTCCDPECRHGLAHYWGEDLSADELRELASEMEATR